MLTGAFVFVNELYPLSNGCLAVYGPIIRQMNVHGWQVKRDKTELVAAPKRIAGSTMLMADSASFDDVEDEDAMQDKGPSPGD